ncbi:hypothetical protein H7U19_05790 [Hyunsoonleella sp. SJ7]|uniref:ABC transporter permease n=1 Tax=Hyunsoonleella aquatilis TaxID=2762758 RepID=A0A923H7C7_9FLAO|nr:hypothetical protein [Hyunsoonleella aquatilis]MBC3757906.1 hypothetical protein [Hyunsoonleella aquatilis]
MNRYFNLSRFFKFLQYDIALHKKKYVLFALVMFVVLCFASYYLLDDNYRILEEYADSYNFDKQHRDYVSYFVWFYLIFSVVVAGSSFSFFRDKEGTSTYLSLPVSNFEKFFYEFLIRVVLFNLLYLLFFWLSFKLATLMFAREYSRGFMDIPSFGILDSLDFVKNKLDRNVALLSLFSFTTFMFAGASCFKKYALFKTILALGGLFLFAYVVTLILYHILLPSKVDVFGIEVISRDLEDEYESSHVALYSIGALSSLFLLPFAYFKLKEKEA